MTKKWWIIGILVLTVVLAGFLWFSLTDSDKQDAPSPPRTGEPSQDDASGSDPGDRNAEGKDDISENIRESFSDALDSARSLFVQQDLHITALGDSLTQGVGDTTDNGGYVGILEESINQNSDTAAETVQVDNFGKRGNRTDHLLERLDNEDLQGSIREADLILITIGANDVIKVVKDNVTSSLDYEQFVEAQANYEQNLRSILEKIRELNPEASIYLLGVYNPFDKYFKDIPELNQIISDWNRISRQVLTEFDNTGFIPIRDIFEGADEDILWEDNFHPNEAGYKRMAERVLEYIREEIEE
ncbi:hypothetical protein AAV35_001680 [Salimicrobium jeotgali]|uniref:SGNH hydrolase-type esterase domain-containing protein n=1 Tax=Salimicrobium jeotgali TaxID=1230341 RepID=K2G9Y6_9BACI|nr:SGNH/GDSL hydrolase family protein [Salimicrobium jeotgali]AKG03620.1 hypothetical protein AAV35_001680 [Salimicrobium jeotgali]EKE31903.1 hypothetical protein MJ3_05843 [Salimicrobium jeotgali]MBM7696086.1 lysophospholipase L1-like esterase [Salimicrobium jeotgali]